MAVTDNAGAVRPHIFIHTNAKQLIAAMVSAYSMKRNSAHADKFDVVLIQQESYPFFARREGQSYLRKGTTKRIWDQNDLQSFTLTRFMPPALMGHQGRALVVDPDVFAVQDVWELLNRDMQGKAIMCRSSKTNNGGFASSVMLLDCAKLRHWDVESSFNDMFEGKRDYFSWISLLREDSGTIGTFEDEWNEFNTFKPSTKMMHTPGRTQPWKTGLPVDFSLAYCPSTSNAPFKAIVPAVGWLMWLRRKLFSDAVVVDRYTQHPDRNQEAFFFSLLQEAHEKGMITSAQILEAMRRDFIRHDSFEMMKRALPLPPIKLAAS